MIEVDRLMIEVYQITLLQMMENAGHCLAVLARDRFLQHRFKDKRVLVMAGSGGNGGGALTAARRMINGGAQVQIWLSKPSSDFVGTPAHQLEILKQLSADIVQPEEFPTLPTPDLIIDGLLGYSLQGNPRGPAKAMINWTNQQDVPTLALDLPSGFNSSKGLRSATVIQAAATLTLALPKVGLTATANADIVGELYLADISVPPQLYHTMGVNIPGEPLFANNEIVRLK